MLKTIFLDINQPLLNSMGNSLIKPLVEFNKTVAIDCYEKGLDNGNGDHSLDNNLLIVLLNFAPSFRLRRP